MTYETAELSRFGRKPYLMYLFEYGEGAESYFGYTDYDQIVTLSGKTYNPIPINRDDINSSGTLDKSALTITLPAASELGMLYGIYPPANPVAVTVRARHINESGSAVIWVGRIINVSKSGPEMTVTCEPIATSMKRPGLRRYYQYGCPHVLYGNECRADKLAVGNTVILDELSNQEGLVLKVPAGWNLFSRAKYNGGLVEWETDSGDTHVRSIISTGTLGLNINLPPTGAVIGTAVNIYPGCNHRLTDCSTLHVDSSGGGPNTPNFGGFPWIPLKNPIGLVSQY